MTRARTHIRFLLTGLLLVTVMAAPASADPIADKKAEAARLVKRIEELRTTAERLSEQYNKAAYELQLLNADIVLTQSEIAAKDNESSALSKQAAQTVIGTYLFGDPSGPTQVINELNGANSTPREAYLSVLLGDLNDVADQVSANRQDSSARKKKLDEQQARKADLIATTERKRKEAGAASEQAKTLLERTKGDLAVLVKQEEERRAAAAAAAAKKAAEERIAKERAAAAAAASAAAAAELRRAADATAARVNASQGVPSVKKPAADAPTYNYPAPSAGAAKAVAAAKSQIGVPYIWATAEPGVSFDCSGLTMWAWAQAGVSMGHFTGAQYAQFPKVPYEALQPGDLVFFGSDLHHMGMYIGGGMMIDAPHTGAWVRYASILGGDYAGAVRPG